MTSPGPPPKPDRGAGLGAFARALTRVFSTILGAGRAVPRALRGLATPFHALGRTIAARFRALDRMMAALRRRVARTYAALARHWDALGRWGHAHARALRLIVGVVTVVILAVVAVTVPGAAAAGGSVALLILLAALMCAVIVGVVVGIAVGGKRLALVLRDPVNGLRRAVSRLAKEIAPVVRRSAAAVARTFAAIAHGIAVVLAATGAAVRWLMTPALRWVGHALHAIGRAVESAGCAIGHVLTAVGRAIGHVLGSAGRAIGAVASRLTAASAVVARPVGHVIARAWAWTVAVVARLARPVGRVARRAGDAIERALAVVGRGIAVVAVVAQHVGWRIAHVIGVAVVKARLAHRAVDDTAMLAAARARATDRVSPPTVVRFQTEVDQNEYLFHGGTEVHAVVTVRADGSLHTGHPESATVILLDCSGSMGLPWAKLRRARAATAASIDSLRDDSWFAIVRATDTAEVLYPPDGSLVPATDDTRRAARESLRLLWPEGGTAMGRWLRLASALVDERPGAIAHAILLTDGRNESETAAELEAALRECTGHLQCDCRGIGTDWAVDELRTIATRTVGSVDIVADPRDLEADFRSMTDAAMAKQVGDVRLRIRTPRGATLRFVQQVSPSISDLTRLRKRVGDRAVEVPTGAWGTETREYHLCFDVPARAIGEEMRVAQITLEVGDLTAAVSLVRAVWTTDEERATQVSHRVALATGQAELVDNVRAGLAARRAGDEDTATWRLGRAVAIAARTGNDDTMRLLRSVVDVDDEETGTVRFRRDVDMADEMALDARSSRTTRLAASASASWAGITEP